jgi:DNA repair exonuclease SbcCD ATPase subunit
LNNTQFQVKFKSEKILADGDSRTEFNLDISSSSGGKSYDALSSGEKQICSFAVGLALSDLTQAVVGGSSNLLILDEPFTNLDPVNSAHVVNYISGELVKTRDTILLVSNEEHLKSLIPNRIHIVKNNGVSTIEQGR